MCTQKSGGVQLFVIIVLFSALAYFKYTNFLIDQVNAVLSLLNAQAHIARFDIVLPVGISFFTFQAAGYIIDVYRKDTKAEKNFITYALFVSFFPQLVAGPIERSGNLLRQLKQTYTFDARRVFEGLLIMLWGLLLKMTIADRCALIADTVFNNCHNFTGVQLVIGAIAFSIQIYCDFMGYSTVARGAGRVLGVSLIDNFRQPYFATGIQDFWRRWHISLSFWLKDYLYIPLGGSRCSRLKTYRNVLVTFLASGLWHGASWNFVVWGGLHGVYIVIASLLRPLKERVPDWFKVDRASLSWQIFVRLETYILVLTAWVFFRCQDLATSWWYLAHCLEVKNIGILFTGGLYNLGIDPRNFVLLSISLALLGIFSLLRELKVPVMKHLWRQPKVFVLLFIWFLVTLVLLATNLSGKEFIYFQF